jgi:hypothetical protein
MNPALTKKLQSAVEAQSRLNVITTDPEMCAQVSKVAHLIAGKRVELAIARFGNSYGEPAAISEMIWSIEVGPTSSFEDSNVSIRWKSNWTTGRADSGTFNFSMRLLIDEVALLQTLFDLDADTRSIRKAQEKAEFDRRMQEFEAVKQAATTPSA